MQVLIMTGLLLGAIFEVLLLARARQGLKGGTR